MNTQVRVVGALAAIAIVVAVLGIILIPRPTPIGGFGPPPNPSSTPVPSVSPSPASSATASSSPAIIGTVGSRVIPPGSLCSSTISTCVTGTLEAGTYSFDAGYVTPGKVTFTVPAGWTTDQGFVRRDGAPNVFFVTMFVTDVYTDACHWTKTVSAGTTVDQLTSLLVAQKGRVATTPTNVAVGGFPAKQIQLTIPAGFDEAQCESGLLHFWPDPGSTTGGLCCTAAGSTDVVDIVNVGGQTFVLVARHEAGSSPADLAELDAIVASIKIETSTSSPGPSGASPSP